MQRIRALTLYQKIVLLILLMMALLFTILYPVTISREGLLYEDTILLPRRRRQGWSTRAESTVKLPPSPSRRGK